MATKIELTEQEQSIIQEALNHYWNDAEIQLENKRQLGDIEKALLEQRKKLTLPLIKRFENIY